MNAALTMRGKDWTAISLDRFIMFANHLDFFPCYINLDFMMITLGWQFVFYEFGHSPAIIRRVASLEHCAKQPLTAAIVDPGVRATQLPAIHSKISKALQGEDRARQGVLPQYLTYQPSQRIQPQPAIDRSRLQKYEGLLT